MWLDLATVAVLLGPLLVGIADELVAVTVSASRHRTATLHDRPAEARAR